MKLPQNYRTSEVLSFYGRDALSVSERVGVNGLRKCVLIGGAPALLDIRFEEGQAVYSADATDVAAAEHVVARMLGLTAEAEEFEARFATDPIVGPLIERRRGLRIPLTPDPWEALAWAIMGQQISLKVAVILRRRLIEAAGQKHASGLIAHPPASAVAALDVATLRDLKFSGSKAEYLLAAARAVVAGDLPLDNERALLTVRGIGPWTVQYFFLRGLGHLDCLPAGDAGLAQGLARLIGTRPSESEIRRLMAPY